MEKIKILHKGLVPETVYMCKMGLDMGPTSIPPILIWPVFSFLFRKTIQKLDLEISSITSEN